MRVSRIPLLSALLLSTAFLSAAENAPDTSRNRSAAAAQLALPPPTAPGVSVGGRWVFSAEEHKPTEAWLLDRARQTLAANGSGLNKLVSRWPDLASELLRNSAGSASDLSGQIAIAETYDRLTGVAEERSGWSVIFGKSNTRRDSFVNFHRTREKVLSLIQSGQFSDGARIDLAASLSGDAPAVLKTEALRVAGLAALLNTKPDRAAEFFAKALEAGKFGPRHVLFEVGLLLSEAERRREHAAQSAAAWTSAIANAKDVRDPDLWERAILAKPSDANWPSEAALEGADDTHFDGPADTADVLIGIGKMRLSRAAFQPALLAFSRAEAETAVAGKQGLARLYRAQTMIALGQAASALPMLETLIKGADPRIARRAQAILGDQFCHVLNDRQRGIPMLREALENPAAAADGNWPGKWRLTANLGLYSILESRDAEGLTRLHEAEAHFEADELWDDLAEALTNEAASLRSVGKTREAADIQKRADEVCRKAGLPIGPATKNTER